MDEDDLCLLAIRCAVHQVQARLEASERAGRPPFESEGKRLPRQSGRGEAVVEVPVVPERPPVTEPRRPERPAPQPRPR